MGAYLRLVSSVSSATEDESPECGCVYHHLAAGNMSAALATEVVGGAPPPLHGPECLRLALAEYGDAMNRRDWVRALEAAFRLERITCRMVQQVAAHLAPPPLRRLS